MSAPSDKQGRFLGLLAIIGVWLVAGYLLLYYFALSQFGALRLHGWMGDRFYNLLIPAGGFWVFYRLALNALIWSLPVALFMGLLSALPPWRRRMRRRATAGVAVLLTAALQIASFDGWPSMLTTALTDDTEFARGYSATGFWGIRSGTTMDAVLAQLGEPMTTLRAGGMSHGEGVGMLMGDEEYWIWSRSPNSKNFRLRALHFRGGEVVAKITKYHYD